MIVFRSAENIAFDQTDTLQICNEILKQKPTQVFLTLVWENWRPVSPTLRYADEFFYKHGIQVTWIVNHWSKPYPQWKTFKNPVVFFDYVLWRMYQLTVVQKKSKINRHWNPDADRYLFLTGKPYKPQRIGLLYKLYKQGLLDRCNYSLFMDPGMKEKSRPLVPEATDSEYNEFVRLHTRSPDNIAYLKQDGDMHYGGVPYDDTLYANSLFRVVSETTTDSIFPYITEKTWLTVLNCNPFIIAGDLNSCKYLQSRGLATFDKIFDIPTYDNIASAANRLEHIVAHVEQWLSGKFNRTEVADMVEHNHKRFLELAIMEQHMLEEQINHSALAIDTRDILTRD
jgi:hypothetical protein